MAAKTRRYKRPSSGTEHARRQQQLLQSYVTQRQLSMTDCQAWPCADSAYPPGTDYAAAAAACQSASEVASCRYQSTAAVKPPYRHDLLAVVPAIGPGETGPAAERLKQMAAHYQRLAAASDGDGGGAPTTTSSFGCYDDRYSYELYDEFAAQCQRFAVQPQYPHQSLYYDASAAYSPMVGDVAHGYLNAPCNGVAQPQQPTNSSHSQFALEPAAISASHVTPQFSYNGGLAGNVPDGVSRYMSPCAQQTTTTTTGLQAPAVSLYSSSVTSPSPCQPTLMSTSRQTSMCFATEPRRSPVDNFLDIYTPPPSSLTMSTSSNTSPTSPQLSSRRASTSTLSGLQLACVAAPVTGRSSWTMAAGAESVGASTTWLKSQMDGVTTSPDADEDAASAFCDLASRGLDSGGAKPVVDAELFSRQSSLGGIELY